ncbi:CocE/NonD family hydrolase [Roseiarcaceae bacterium H3SJ34-1]|uniref:CocE/NonD family hydrolase n=1 Tax=Terripilifer ovatus TaxID=3032367 RepID=UPI003AB961B4|nr:CocE/NonD family hydrolase [Roseiarcaceae bacterium H3SJ34-1]
MSSDANTKRAPAKPEQPYRMIFEQDVAVPVSDGLVLRANVFRPDAEGRFPVVMAQGVYGKDLHFEDGFKAQWDQLIAVYPDLCGNGSTGKYLRWETADPERWVPDGFVIVQVDSRGAGKSPGYLDPRSPREITDYYDAIEWAARQPWSNGRIGLLGISYYAVTQWRVATLQPPHLAAMCPWEGYVDYYRDSTHHGGILSSGFANYWWPKQCLAVQHGNAKSPHRERGTGRRINGDESLSEGKLEANRTDYIADILRHNLDSAWWRERTPVLSRIEVPLFSAGNWGGAGMHLRGNIEGYLGAGSKDKWLSLHAGKHWESFYLPEYVAMQKRFFNHFLRGDDNGWDKEPRVKLVIRDPRGDKFRTAAGFPPPDTRMERFYLDAVTGGLASASPSQEATASYEAMSEGVSFSTAPFERDTEFTGFVSAKLWVSSSTNDMDLFAVLRAFDERGQELVINGAHEASPVSRGWLRVSHRRLDADKSNANRVFHAHDEIEKLTPDEVYEIDVEIWPTTMVFPKGYRLVLTLMGKDFEFPGIAGRILHQHPGDRGRAEFLGTNRIFTGGGRASYLMLPAAYPATR